MNELPRGKMFVEYPVTRDGQVVASRCREPTEQERSEAVATRKQLFELINQRDQLDAQIRVLRDSCKHVVSYDVAGWPYDSRQCAGCDHDQGLV